MAGERDCAAGIFKCGFADGEAEAGSAGCASTRRIGAIEALEDVGEIGRVDSFAVVLDCDLD